MSEPPNTPATILVGSHHHSGGGAATTSTSIVREYRKGNWTLQETLILIQAKKLDDERRIKANSTPPDPKTPAFRTGELRWKWVENYCWNNGCLRSQNQCNDKWDNLLRDYKKVREYQMRSDGSDELPSYWNMEKHDRKNRNLPSNLSPEIYEALNEVVHRRSYPQKTNQPASALASPATVPALPPPPVTSRAAASGSVMLIISVRNGNFSLFILFILASSVRRLSVKLFRVEKPDTFITTHYFWMLTVHEVV